MTDERKAEIRKQIEDLVTDPIDNMRDSKIIDLWNECGEKYLCNFDIDELYNKLSSEDEDEDEE